MSKQNTPLFKFLEGKTALIMTDAEVKVPLKVVSVQKVQKTFTEPDTPENDWWGQTHKWEEYELTFENGHKRCYKNVSEIEIETHE